MMSADMTCVMSSGAKIGLDDIRVTSSVLPRRLLPPSLISRSCEHTLHRLGSRGHIYITTLSLECAATNYRQCSVKENADSENAEAVERGEQ